MKTQLANRQLRDLPPRNINLYTKATILFGGFLQLFGWIFFLMGSLFAWIFLPASEVAYWFEFGKDWQEIPGKVVTSESTNSAVNDQLVYRYLHSFELDGQRFTGKSYTTGQQYLGGEQVTVRYNANDPNESYMAGTKRATFPAFVLFVLIFPLVGLGFIVHAIWHNRKAVKLLEIGDFTRGTLVSKNATNATVTINGSRYPIYKYQFEFDMAGKKYSAHCKTHQGWLVEDEEREIILFDRFNPEFNMVFDAAPNVPAITEDGHLESAGLAKAVFLLAPLAGIGLHLFFLMVRPSIIQ